ncbi:TonB-dependent receptor plug domain-containing protein [Formosa sp. S-31]|uniref:TonB-dependent receptor plug domain-containing protein n=1 Tax=Formosa sp. S-31 TaxID=2790949 RepID=UPI003EBC4707
MSLNKNNIILFLNLITAISVKAQSDLKDSLNLVQLDEVVITGQYNPQSIKKSIHNVTVINREKIENQAANNLADVLNFNLNLTVIPNSQTGRSTISFFGLDGQYFNILIDNIPMVSGNGLGNNIDLTTINLDDVERVEIVEGAMGVDYGANAVSGVINIITKKKHDNIWNVQASVQEETVSDEYAWFNEGRHIQALNLAHNFNTKWSAKLGVNRNQFAGFYNNKLGKDHYQNDGLRGYDWLPKTQLNSNALINYQSDNLNIFYKFEFFNELINYFDATVRPNIDVTSQTSNPSASDKIYTTNRFVNNLNIDGHFKTGAHYTASLSYQNQKRNLNAFNYYILTRDKTNETKETYQSSQVLFSKGTINDLIKQDYFDFQLGYETRYIEGFDTQASGSITQLDKTKSQSNIAIFGSSEIKLSERISIRPGIRYEYNSMFHSKTLGTLSARYSMSHGFELRANLGTSYRTPNFEELYYYFVDSNHDVRGNENLKPEKGYSAFINLKKYSWVKSIALQNTLKLSYLNVNDKIDLAIVNTLPLKYQYINIDAYKLWGLTSENSIKKGPWAFNLGATVQGISRITNNEVNAENDFLYSFQLNTSSTYNIKKWNTVCALLLKYNGKQQNYIASGTDDNGNALFEKATTDAYSWMDVSIRKSFFQNSTQITIGARNLFDVTNVTTSSPNSQGTHSTNNSNLLLGYGRSFYLKLLYKPNF